MGVRTGSVSVIHMAMGQKENLSKLETTGSVVSNFVHLPSLPTRFLGAR